LLLDRFLEGQVCGQRKLTRVAAEGGL